VNLREGRRIGAMDSTAIENCGRRLNSRMPLIGGVLRRSACRKLAQEGSAACVPHLVEALGSDDVAVRELADAGLRALESQEAIDALCELAIADPTGAAAQIVKDLDYRPEAVSRRCVLFLLTGQVERYVDLDFEAQYARAEYQAAGDDLKRRIAEVVRQSGDTRLLPILQEARPRRGGIDKRARELTDEEAGIVLEVYGRQGQWAEIFSLLFHIPLAKVVDALDLLSRSDWRPESPEDAALLEELLVLRGRIGEMPEAPPEPEVALGPAFGKWVAAGRSAEAKAKSVEQLRQDLQEAPPPVAVAALAGLSVRGGATQEDIETARTHKHWPVRLGCLALCDIAPEFLFSKAPIVGEGGGLWIEQLSPALHDGALRRQRARDLTLDQLEAISDALNRIGDGQPARAACGRVLYALGTHRLRDTIEIDDEMIIRIDETDIEIEG